MTLFTMTICLLGMSIPSMYVQWVVHLYTAIPSPSSYTRQLEIQKDFHSSLACRVKPPSVLPSRNACQSARKRTFFIGRGKFVLRSNDVVITSQGYQSTAHSTPAYKSTTILIAATTISAAMRTITMYKRQPSNSESSSLEMGSFSHTNPFQILPMFRPHLILQHG